MLFFKEKNRRPTKAGSWNWKSWHLQSAKDSPPTYWVLPRSKRFGAVAKEDVSRIAIVIIQYFLLVNTLTNIIDKCVNYLINSKQIDYYCTNNCYYTIFSKYCYHRRFGICHEKDTNCDMETMEDNLRKWTLVAQINP